MIKDLEHVLVYQDPEHCINQGSIVRLKNGELFLGYNQERGKIHDDSGQACFIKSFDNGKSWDISTQKVVYPFTENEGNWDCAFSQSSDGTILMHTRVNNFMNPTALGSNVPQEVGGGVNDIFYTKTKKKWYNNIYIKCSSFILCIGLISGCVYFFMIRNKNTDKTE